MTVRPSSPILIAGAGVAGLTSAIGLLRAGISVTVLEQAPVLVEAGAGLSLAPNATRALASLGLLPALRRISQQPHNAEVRHYVTLFMLAEAGPGEARRLEPHKCQAWAWHPWQQLPQPLFAPLASLRDGGFVPA